MHDSSLLSPRVEAVELGQSLTDSRAAGEVQYGRGRALQRQVMVAA